MRKFKISFVLILLIALVGCTENGMQEDTTPVLEQQKGVPEITEDGPIEEFDEIPEETPTPTSMKIVVVYPPQVDRQDFRNTIGPLLGMNQWENCTAYTDREIWTMRYRTNAEFSALLGSIFQNVTATSGSTQSSGPGNEPYADYEATQSSAPTGPGNTTTNSETIIRFLKNGGGCN